MGLKECSAFDKSVLGLPDRLKIRCVFVLSLNISGGGVKLFFVLPLSALSFRKKGVRQKVKDLVQ